MGALTINRLALKPKKAKLGNIKNTELLHDAGFDK